MNGRGGRTVRTLLYFCPEGQHERLSYFCLEGQHERLSYFCPEGQREQQNIRPVRPEEDALHPSRRVT